MSGRVSNTNHKGNMTYKQALDLIGTAVLSNRPSKINPSMTQTEAIDIVHAAIQEGMGLGKADQPVPDWLEKRTHQLTKNQRRPRY